MSFPRNRFGVSLDPESFQNFERFYLSVTIYPGKKDPNADVIAVQISGVKDEKWETIKRFSLYKDAQGYSQLPDRLPPVQNQEIISKEDTAENLSNESDDSLLFSNEE